MNATKLLGLLISVSAMLHQGESNTEMEAAALQRLTRDLLKTNPEMTLPPSPDGSGGPVVVQIEFSLVSISELNDKGFVEMVGWLILRWKDKRMSFNTTEYAGINGAYLPYDKIWTPDIELYNSVTPGMTILNQGKLHVFVSESGLVTMFPMITTRSSCDVFGQMSRGNHIINCTLNFGSWVYAIDNLDLELSANAGDAMMSEFQDVGKWTVVSSDAKRIEKLYSCCPEPFVFVDFTLSFKERDV